MNTQVLLTEKQEIDRVQEGLRIYNANLIQQLNKREYLVKNQYVVEDLSEIGDIEPYLTCSCKDFEYRHVVCKHINAVTFLQLNGGA